MFVKGARLFDFTRIQVNQSAGKATGDDSFNWKTERILGALMYKETWSHNLRVFMREGSLMLSSRPKIWLNPLILMINSGIPQPVHTNSLMQSHAVLPKYSTSRLVKRQNLLGTRIIRS